MTDLSNSPATTGTGTGLTMKRLFTTPGVHLRGQHVQRATQSQRVLHLLPAHVHRPAQQQLVHDRPAVDLQHVDGDDVDAEPGEHGRHTCQGAGLVDQLHTHPQGLHAASVLGRCVVPVSRR